MSKKKHNAKEVKHYENTYTSVNAPQCINFTLDMIYNSQNLNLFSDASMGKSKYGSSSCYGSILLQGDTMIEEIYKYSSNCTVPAAELRGIRLSLDLALRYRDIAPIINIFSDSQISIFTLKNYYYTWIYDYQTNQYYAKSAINTGNPAKNQNLIIECISMLNELRKTNIVNLYHQKGHIDNKFSALDKAINTFKVSNNISGVVDYNLVRYISTYNNYIDNKTRHLLKMTDTSTIEYRDPITFHPMGNIPLIYQNQL